MNYFINATRIWTIQKNSDAMLIRVKNKTSYIMNKEILLKKRADLPDGLYSLDMVGCLVPKSLPHGVHYPDVDLIPAHLESKQLSIVTPELGMQIVEACKIIHNAGYEVVLDQHGLRAAYNGENLPQITFNFVGEVKELRLRMNAKYLEIVLTSFREYPALALLKDLTSEDSPLIIGYDAGTCAQIVVPRRL